METSEEKRESLWSLQDRLLELEESINSETELEFLLGDIAQKIDNIKFVIDTFEIEAERFKRYKDEMAKRQKSLENAAERLKGYVIKCLESHGTSFERGKLWNARIRENKRIETFKEPDTMTALELIPKFSGILKTSYSWDKSVLKRLLESPHDPILDDYAKFTTIKSLSFSAINILANKEKESTNG